MRTSHHRRPMGGRGSRRGGGGRPASAAWTPLSDPDTVLWLDAALSARTESGGVIDQVDNLVPSGANATATLTARPAYGATTIGGAYPGIIFDGVNDRLSVALGSALSGATGITVIAVAVDTLASGSAAYVLEYGSSGGTGAGEFALIPNIGNANSLSFYATGNVGNNFWRSAASSEDLATPKVIGCRADFTAAAASEVPAIRVNGAALSGAQTGTSNNTGGFGNLTLTIGARSTGASPWVGKLGALVIVKRALSDAEILVFERYLGDRFGLPFDDVMATRTVPRVLWMGQSNSLGNLDTFTTLALWNGPHVKPRIYGYKNTKILASGPITDTWGGLRENQPSGYGWEGPDLVTCLELVRNYALAPELIMVAEGSTTLGASWDPAAVGAMFDRLETAWADALATHPAAPASPVPWVVWIQGESDAASAPYAAAYEANLAAFIAAVRALDGMASAKWVITKLHPDCSLGDATTIGQIRAAQDAVEAADPDVYTVEASDLTLQGDSLHYTEASAIVLGQRIAAVIGANT